MRISIFSSLHEYLSEVSEGLRSVFRAFMAAAPYVIGTGELRKEVTEQYPDPISSKTPDDLSSRSRGMLFNDIDRCIGCRECERVCPARAIQIETERGADPNQLWVTTFDVDYSKCIFCGLCVEACVPSSLVHTKRYEGAVYDLTGMVARFGRGSVTPEERANWEKSRRMTENDEVWV